LKKIFDNYNFELNSFADRTIGISVFERIDISQRSFLYVKLIIIFLILYPVSNLIFHKIDSIVQSKVIKNILLNLTASSTFLLVYQYFQKNSLYFDLSVVLLFLSTLICCLLFFRIVFKKTHSIYYKITNNYNFIVLSLMLPIVPFFIRWILTKGTFTFKHEHFLIYAIFWTLFWCFTYFFTKVFSKKNILPFTNSVLAGAIPLMFIPASVVLSNELQFTLSNTTLYQSVYKYSFASMVTLILFSIVIFVISFFKKTYDFKSIASKLYLPIFISTLVIFKIHSNFIELPIHVDMFHHGENLISVQQLFTYNKIPFIDIYPTHGISYFVPQFLYSLVNGYKAFEPWLWEWVTKIIEVLLLYFVFKKITNSFFAAILISFLPILSVFGGSRFVYGYDTTLLSTYYFMSFLPFLVLTWMLKKPDLKRILIYWFTCLFLFLWRVDFGISNIIAGLAILTIILIGQKYGQLRSMIKQKNIFLSIGIVFILGLLSFFTISIITDIPIYEIIIQNLKFISIQSISQGLPAMAGPNLQFSFFQYFLLPMIGIFYILIFVTKIFTKKNYAFNNKDILLVSIALFSLIISIRSTQRQTLAVLGLNQYFFVFLGLCIPFYVKRYKIFSIFLFIIMLFLYQILFPNNLILAKGGKQVAQYEWVNKESRIKINDNQYRNITNFINNNLGVDQTFVDLTSSPLLYVTTNREFINYFIPNTYYTSESIQKIILENLNIAFSDNKIPIVIFKQPIAAANLIDTVPNEVRSYRIYEYIYKNYLPIGEVDNYSIWTKRGYEIKDSSNLTKTNNIVQNFDLKYLPYMWANFDEYDALNNKVQVAIINSPIKLDPKVSRVFKLEKDISKEKGNYIYLKIISSLGGKLKISYGKDPALSSVEFNLLSSELPVDYMVRISSLYNWMYQDNNDITIISSSNLDIIKLDVKTGD